MSKSICIMGESGAGKTTSMRNLPPEETLYIDADGKGMSWKGWKTQYNKDAGNYMRCDNPKTVMAALLKADKTERFKYVVIDTVNGIMVADEMRRSKEKGFDKWMELASSVYEIVDQSNRLRDDLTVICLAHSETVTDDMGYRYTRIKTSGKKLSKIVLESKFTTVLLAKCVEGKYLFETKAKNSTAKTPMGAFEEEEIENDIAIVLEALEEF